MRSSQLARSSLRSGDPERGTLRGRVKSARPRSACARVGARGRAMVIRFFASIRNITGVKEIEWDGPTPTLGELLRLLSERYGPEFRGWALDGEDLGGSVMVVINGEDARHQGGVETRLAPTDVISILPIMAGGNLAAEGEGGGHGSV